MKQEDMKKFVYKLELYQFKANNDLASNIEKAFCKGGAERLGAGAMGSNAKPYWNIILVPIHGRHHTYTRHLEKGGGTMKIRLAKKIMAQQPYGCGGKMVNKHPMRYWHWRWLEW